MELIYDMNKKKREKKSRPDEFYPLNRETSIVDKEGWYLLPEGHRLKYIGFDYRQNVFLAIIECTKTSPPKRHLVKIAWKKGDRIF